VIVNSNYIKFDTGALGTALMFTAAGGGEMSNNYIYNAPTSINNTNGSNIGTPQMLGNTCVAVTTATNCNVLGDQGAQKFTGTLTMSALGNSCYGDACRGCDGWNAGRFDAVLLSGFKPATLPDTRRRTLRNASPLLAPAEESTL
jgi:hypothetical protein